MSIVVKAVRDNSRLRVDVDPDRANKNYALRVQRHTKSGGWKTIRKSTTKGKLDVRVLDLRRGKYRVVAISPTGSRIVSKAVRLDG